jgi:Leucine-rich repeat (LRR) protein
LQPFDVVDSLAGCFNSLTELRLNNTLMTWKDILTVIASMPKLQELECGHNRLIDAAFEPECQHKLNTPVRTLNLDSNQICGWTSVYLAFLEFPSYDIFTLPYGLDVTDCMTLQSGAGHLR